ncbi:RimK family alpha-L-glutamate ligase [Kitasatospora griseola]|uniref:RimK family alpha-L-glutamate ligase n=1 Tax=Kitasatospora griseola TaxID=2064 RepID=UPI0036D93A84
MAEEPLPEAELWLLLGPAVRESPVAKRLARDFAAAFGSRFAVVSTDRVLLGVTGGKLTLHDLAGRPITPPRAAVVRLAMTPLSTDREITLLRQLQAMGTQLINPPEAILTCVNKFWQLQALAGAGLPVPDTRTYTDTRPDLAVAAGIPEPCVVKAVRGSGGHQVFLARDAAMVADVQGCLRPDVPFLFQRYVRHSHGRDLRVIVVEGRAVAVGLRSSANGLMQSNVSLGGTVEPCPGRFPVAEQLAVRAAEQVGLVLAGVDLLFEEDGTFTLCEVNANVRWGARVTQVTDALIAACASRLT